MTEFTEEKLAELRAVAEAATPGPWQWMDGGVSHSTSFGWQPVTLPGESAQHIAAFDPPTTLALIAALEAKTAEVEGYKQHYPCDGGCNYTDGPQEGCSLHGRNPRELWEAIGGLTRDRDEARAEVSRIEGSAIEWSKRAEKAEAALERVRAVRAGYPECDKYDDDSPVSCGWKRTVQSIDAVLEALERADDE